MSQAAAKKDSEPKFSDDSLRLTKQLQEQFLNNLEENGRKEQTVRAYRRSVGEFYDFLPRGKMITGQSIEDWRENLKERGLSDSAVNLRLTALNSLLRYCGKRGLTAPLQKLDADEQPGLSREEYLHFLSSVKEDGREREFFLIKVFACTDIAIGELDRLTVESCRSGSVELEHGRQGMIPESLQRELLDYVSRHGIEEGPVFATKLGKPLDRSNITKSIRGLADKAGIDPEKCSPRALHRLYLSTQEKIREEVKPIEQQAYESLLNTEQAVVAWE